MLRDPPSPPPAPAPSSPGARLCDCLRRALLGDDEAAALRAALRAARADAAAARADAARAAAERDWAAVDASAGRLARRYECRICFARPIDAVLLPCGHALCCGPCAAPSPRARVPRRAPRRRVDRLPLKLEAHRDRHRLQLLQQQAE